MGVQGWRFPSAGTRVGVGTGHPYDHSVPARLGKGQGAKEIGHILANNQNSGTI